MKKIHINKKFIQVLGLSIIILIIWSGSFFRVFDNFELSTLDFRYQLRPKIPISEEIVLIEIANDTIEQLGQFPIDRNYYSAIVQALSEAGAHSILFDVFFSEPREYDDEFEKAIHTAGNVYLPNVLSFDVQTIKKIPIANSFAAETIDNFALPARGLGHINVIPDRDGKFRRVPLFVKYNDKYYPYISFKVALDYLNFKEEDINIKEGKQIKVGHKLKIPLDEHSTMLINFTGPWGKSYKHYSFVDILKSHFTKLSGEKPLLDLSIFKGKICIIGLTAEGTTDLHPNPYEPLYPAVGIHAEVLNSVLQNNFIARASRFVNLLILVMLLSSIMWISFHFKPIRGVVILTGVVLSFIVVSILLFILLGVWINVFYPVLMTILTYIGCTVFQYLVEWKKRSVMENEMTIAKKIQESILPKSLPDFKGLDVAVYMNTARHVGGDLYDFLQFSDHKMGVMLGDVTGKGVPASLFMAMTVSAFKFFAKEDVSPESSLYDLNVKLSKESTSNLFVTMYYTIFDTQERTVSYASGGHLPMLYLSKDQKPQYLDVEDGMPIGMLEGPYSGNKLNYKTGDVFVIYTDGITEAKNDKGMMYEQPRLAEFTEQHKDKSAQEILDLIAVDVRRWEPPAKQSDDITFLVIKIVD